MSIVITGANGQLGRLVIRHLLRIVEPDRIVACVRRLESGEEFEKQGIAVRLCDYDKPDSLEQAFAGASRLLLISSSHPDDTVRTRQHAHAIEAAKRAKAEHLLYTSFAYPNNGSGPPLPLHRATENAILATGIPYTFLRNALYIDFIGALGLNEAIRTGTLGVAPGDWTFNSVTRSDLAEAYANVLAESGHRNRIYELTAPSRWTFEQLANALSELSGKPIEVRQDPLNKHWLYGFLGKIDTSSTSADLERLLRRPVASLRDNVKEVLESLS